VALQKIKKTMVALQKIKKTMVALQKIKKTVLTLPQMRKTPISHQNSKIHENWYTPIKKIKNNSFLELLQISGEGHYSS
jgi:hypothetical protein